MAKVEPEVRTAIPPYVPWKTFSKFIEGLRAAMPSRIDRSLMGTMSGAIQAQLTATLRYLDLVTENGTVTDRLRALIKASTVEDRREQLADIIFQAYRPVMGEDPESGGVDQDNGTYKQLYDAFAATGAQGETIRKCIAFWLAANKDANLTVSPHFTARGVRASSRGPRGKRGRSVAKGTGSVDPEVEEDGDEDDSDTPPVQRSRFEVLMSKFPTFDPAWAPEVQAKWFDAFARLQQEDEGD